MEIPYTVTPRRDTGLYNAKVGIWLFLASEVMLFGALFSSYILLRVGALEENWPHGLLNIPIGTFNTAVLIISSVTVVMAWASLKMGNFKKGRMYLGLTILCALAFVGIKTKEYNDKFTHYAIRFKDEAGTTAFLKEAFGNDDAATKAGIVANTYGLDEAKRPFDVRDLQITGHIEGNPRFWSLAKLNANKTETVQFIADPPMHPKRGAEAKAEAHAEHKAHTVKISDLN